MEPVVAESNVLNQPHIDTPTMVSDDDDIIAINSGNNEISLSVIVKWMFNLTDKVKFVSQDILSS